MLEAQLGLKDGKAPLNMPSILISHEGVLGRLFSNGRAVETLPY